MVSRLQRINGKIVRVEVPQRVTTKPISQPPSQVQNNLAKQRQEQAIQDLLKFQKTANERASTQKKRTSRKGWEAAAQALDEFIGSTDLRTLSPETIAQVKLEAGKIRIQAQKRAKSTEKTIKLSDFNVKRSERELEKNLTIIKKAQNEKRSLNVGELKTLGFTNKQITEIGRTQGKTIGELKKEGLSFKQIGDIGGQRLRNQLLTQQKQIKKELLKRESKSTIENNRSIQLLKQSLTGQQVQAIKPQIKQNKRFTAKTLDKLNSIRQRNVGTYKASLAGVASLPFAATEVALDFIQGVASVIKNPVQTAVVISQIRKQDISNAGKSFGGRLQSGDPKALVELVSLVPKYRIPMINKLVAKIIEDANSPQQARSIFNLKQNLVKGSGSIEIKTNGLTQGNQKFSSTIKLAIRPVNKTLFGTITKTIGKKTTTQKLSLKDKGSFYIDNKTGIKIPKSDKELSSVQIKTQRLKTKILGNEARLTADISGFITQGKKTVKKEKIFISPTLTTSLSKTEKVKFERFLGTREGKRYIDFREKGKRVQDIKTSSIKSTKKKTSKDWDKVNKFLEFIDFDKNIINGLDKRFRISYLLGLNKKSTQRFIKRYQQDILNGYIVKSAKLTAQGSFDTLKPARFTLGPAFVLSKPKIFNKFKKNKLGNLQTPQTIKIPQLDSLLNMPRRLNIKIKLPTTTYKRALTLGVAQNYSFKNISKTKKTTDIDKIRKTQQIKIPKTKTKTIITPKTKKITKLKTLKKIPIKRVKSPKVKITKPPRKPRRIPRLRLKLKNLPTKGKRQGYIIRIKKGNSVVAETSTELPLKRATNLARKIVDGVIGKYPLASSYSLVKGKQTSIVDVKKTILGQKFRGKKSKNPKVQESVEKRKHRLDRKKEQLAAAKAKKSKVKKGKKSKTIKKRKVNKSKKK